MNTTTTRSIPLPLMTGADNRATLYTALNAGWLYLCYRKADGTTASRIATRNPSIVQAFGTTNDVKVLSVDNHDPALILYFDAVADGIRSFRVDAIVSACIPPYTPEFPD